MKYYKSFILSIFIVTLIACGGSGGGDNPEKVELLGSLQLTISGQPDGLNAGVLVTRDNNYSETVNSTRTLSNLPVGTYTVTATSLTNGDASYSTQDTSQTVTVAASQATTISISFTQDLASTQKNFPIGLAIASPTETSAESGTKQSKSILSSTGATWTTAYADAVTQINELLNGEVAVNQVFTPGLFFNSGINANCYGPSLKYQDHPDGASPNSGELPGGDLMIWQATDSTSGHTCAAAQLNARLNGIKNQSFAALMSLASMLYVADANSLTLPGIEANLELSDEMNAIGITGVTFTDATIAQGTADQWHYSQTYTFEYNGTDREITLEMFHNTGETEFEYLGVMQYTINGDSTLFGGGNCKETSRSLNGSLAYERLSETDLRIQSRVGILCGENASGFVTADSEPEYLQLDANNRYNSVSNANGWSENFNIFGAEMNPDTLQGSYIYAWQAGVGDGYSRIFLMGVSYYETGGTGPIDGEAYAGFGDPIHSTNGDVKGIICNWAGPGNGHTLQPYAQRQFFTLDATSAVFNTPEGGSDITYAPTDSCTYDGSGSFVYDTDLDRDLADETALGAIALDLMGAYDLDGDTVASIPEAIRNRGYTLPDIPGGLPGA